MPRLLGANPRTGFLPVNRDPRLLIEHYRSILPAQNHPGVISTNFKRVLDALSAFQRNDPPFEVDTRLVFERERTLWIENVVDRERSG